MSVKAYRVSLQCMECQSRNRVYMYFVPSGYRGRFVIGEAHCGRAWHSKKLTRGFYSLSVMGSNYVQIAFLGGNLGNNVA